MLVCFFAAGTIWATGSNLTISKKADNRANNKEKVAKTAKTADNDIIELGPDNIAGRVRGLIFDIRDNTNQTLYAGGVAGGLFKTTDGGQHWAHVPMYLADGTEINLPISCMTQTSDGVIYIGTGEGFVGSGINNSISTPVGRGLYRMTNDTTYFVVPATAPVSDTVIDNTGDWAYINRLAAAEYDNVLYFYAATNTGLFRWKIQSASDWNNAPVKVFTGAVQDIDISRIKKMLFFTSTNLIYKIGSIINDSQNPVEISSSYLDTSNISRIEVAVAPSDENYVYAVVADTNGLAKGVYLTQNQQVWNIITTSTVNLFSSVNKGWHNNTITVFPDNPRKIAVGGNALWIGEGFDGATLFTWTKSAYTEGDLNAGDYMNNVYVSSVFVHSGIHNIVFPSNSTNYNTFYIATDGGVFSTNNAGRSFTMHNKGLNTTQFYSIAIANDASLLGGAQDNSIPFIQSRNASDSADVNTTAQVLWTGNGGGVASSMFQLLTPISRRGIIVSNERSNIGRAYADYSDYTNTQTWSIGKDFYNEMWTTGSDVMPMVLWETTNDTVIKSYATFTLDTNSWVKRGDSVLYVRNPDLTSEDRLNFTIQSGDTILVRSRSHFDYPFEYVFPETFVAKDSLTHTVKNPIQSRLFVAGAKPSGNYIYMTPYPTDFTKIDRSMDWVAIVDNLGKSVPHVLAISPDGNCLYTAIDEAKGGSRLIRFRNLLASTKSNELTYYTGGQSSTSVLKVDTIVFGDTNILQRRITSIAVDPRNGEDNIVVTCGDFENTPNMYYISNASDTNYNVCPYTVINNKMPLYSSLIEMTTGKVYVGSENGLFVSSDSNLSVQATWTPRGNFAGTPIFAIKQQTNNMKYKSTTYLSGANEEFYSWGKTKYPGAIYYATYGRGIYMDKEYITDTTGLIAIEPTPVAKSENTLKVYPNPAYNFAHIDFTVSENTTVDMQLFDMSGRVVYTKNLGKVAAGTHAQVIPCENLNKGVYVVRVAAGNQPMTSKLIVK